MHTSVRVFSSRAHHPLIKFLGKRVQPSSPSTPHAHPAAPPELKQSFADFVMRWEASALSPPTVPGNGAGQAVFYEFWEAPDRFWRPKIRDLEDEEIKAVLSGGASLH